MSGLIVHEWVAPAGGSEKVVEQFVHAFPHADIQVLWDDAPGRFGVSVKETWLSKTVLRRSKAASVPFMPFAWRGLRSSANYDWLLVSSHLFAHHVTIRGQEDLPKLVYTHTPARYIWNPELDSRGDTVPARLASAVLKPLDRRRAQEAIVVAANSNYTAARVRESWQRDAVTIYPPVDVEAIRAVPDWSSQLDANDCRVLASLPSEFLLGASRFVSYKRLDAVIAAGEAAGIPVVLAGRGPDHRLLSALAEASKVQVVIIESPSDELLRALYQKSIAFVFPAIEDFGIMPIEAMAAGTPVIVPSEGGAAESALLTGGGVLFRDEGASDWARAVDQASRIDRALLPSAVDVFSASRFRREIAAWLHSTVRTGVPLASS